MKTENKEYSKSEKLEYFKKLLEEQDKKANLAYAKFVIAEARLDFLKRKVSELSE